MEKIFDLEKNSPEVWKSLLSQCPEIKGQPKEISREYFSQGTCREGIGEKFYRLRGHARSLCLPLSANDKKMFDRPTLIFKGAEPLFNDFKTYMEHLSKSGFRGDDLRSALEHFPLAEGKVTGVCLANEIQLEIKTAVRIQAKFVQSLGRLARIPTPLASWLLDEKDIQDAGQLMRSLCSDYVWSRVETFLSNGLAVGLFYYPGAPIRSEFLKDSNKDYIRKHSDREVVKSELIKNWLDLISDMLALSFLPSTILNFKLGSCTDRGNACIDGGFCDVDSVYLIDERTNDQFVYESMHNLLNTFSITIMDLTGLGSSTTSANYSLYRAVSSELLKRLQTKKGTAKIDARITRFLGCTTLEDAVSFQLASRLTSNGY